MKIGAHPTPTGAAFRVWAPRCRRVEVRLEHGPGAPQLLSMDRTGDYFVAEIEGAGAGTGYRYILDGDRERPDPASRFQPRGVHGPSEIVDPARFAWTDAGWKGVSIAECVIYELHVGTFTAAGTFEAVEARFDHLIELGVNVIELMPVAAFPGERNWGYDGVHLFAPQASYGGPEGLRRLIDAAHARGLGVMIDVVYNHLGPEGNYLRDFGPYFTDRYKTPWGEAVNYDGVDARPVRDWVVANAVHWIEEYHADGLRLDAVHAIFDRSDDRHILAEIAEAVHTVAGRHGRVALVIAESALNDARIVRPAAEGGCGLEASWNDDFHHALRTALTGDRRGYLAPFGTMADLKVAIASGFVRPGEDYRTHEAITPADAVAPAAGSLDLPGERLVGFIQNHDQVANASIGRRFADLAGAAAARVAALVHLTAPCIPLLFMGEEYAETNPFLFFVDFGDEGLRELVRQGRAREQADLGLQSIEEALQDDATDPRTFERSRLSWDTDRSECAGMLRLYRRLLALRKNHPALGVGGKDRVRVEVDETSKTLVMIRGAGTDKPALVAANLGEAESEIRIPFVGVETQYLASLPSLPSLRCFTEDFEYGGSGVAAASRIHSGMTITLPSKSGAIWG